MLLPDWQIASAITKLHYFRTKEVNSVTPDKPGVDKRVTIIAIPRQYIGRQLDRPMNPLSSRCVVHLHYRRHELFPGGSCP